MTFPAHFPYEDGWKFCEVCQRFYKINRSFCPNHSNVNLRTEPLSGIKRMRRVDNQGLGLPLWTKLPEFMATEEGHKSLKQFLDVRKNLESAIKSAPLNEEIKYGDLGAHKFTNHWFIRREEAEGR